MHSPAPPFNHCRGRLSCGCAHLLLDLPPHHDQHSWFCCYSQPCHHSKPHHHSRPAAVEMRKTVSEATHSSSRAVSLAKSKPILQLVGCFLSPLTFNFVASHTFELAIYTADLLNPRASASAASAHATGSSSASAHTVAPTWTCSCYGYILVLKCCPTCKMSLIGNNAVESYNCQDMRLLHVIL